MNAYPQHGMLHAVSGVLTRALEDIRWAQTTLSAIGSQISPPWYPSPLVSASPLPSPPLLPRPQYTVPPPPFPGPPKSGLVTMPAKFARDEPRPSAVVRRPPQPVCPPQPPLSTLERQCVMEQTEQDRQLDKMNEAYTKFIQLERKQLSESPIPFTFVQNVFELEKDLWKDAPEGAAWAHCVGADLLMSKGVAVDFRERFGNVTYLLAQGKTAGQVATLPHRESYVFYLVTKALTKGDRPTLSNYKRSVEELANLCSILGVKTLCMPQIGAGLDRLPWDTCKRIIVEAFQGVATKVLIFRHPDEGKLLKTNKKNKKLSSTERLYSDALKNESSKLFLNKPPSASTPHEPAKSTPIQGEKEKINEAETASAPEEHFSFPRSQPGEAQTPPQPLPDSSILDSLAIPISNSFSPLTESDCEDATEEDEKGENDNTGASCIQPSLPEDPEDNGFSLERPQLLQPLLQDQPTPIPPSPRLTRSKKSSKNTNGQKAEKGK
jgi:O-acetyl-ADP-ribose deacetylase (regulator of RNase III)